MHDNSHNAHYLKNAFIVSYENRILCKTKCKSKQAGIQKYFLVFISWRMLLWKEKIAVQKYIFVMFTKIYVTWLCSLQKWYYDQISNTVYLQT